MIKQKVLVSALIAGGLLSPMAYATNGYFSSGYGQKSEGMGGVGIALPQDALAAAANPAGMVMVGDRIDFGLDWFKPVRNANMGGTNYDGNGKSNFFIPNFGYNKMVNNNTSLGVSVYGNGGMNTQYNTNPGFGTGAAGVNLQQLFIAPTWSMKVNPTNAVGVSLNLAYQTFSATGLQGFGLAGYSSNASALSNTGTDSSTGYGLKFGWTGEVTPTVTLGATYQTKTHMGNFNNYSGLFANQGSFDIPATYGVGIAVKATTATTVAFDVQQINYGDIPSIANPNGLGLLGSANGSGFGWQNMTVYKIGVSQVYSPTLTLRAGLSHNNQQISSSQTTFNVLAPGVVQNELSLGATWKLANKSEVTVAYMHAFKQTVNGSTTTVPNSAGAANLSMYEDLIGISYGWN